MIGTLDPKIPPGPLAQKWRNHRDHSRLVSPNNRRKFEIIVVGSGLAARVKCARHLRASKRAICQQPPVLAGEGHTLRDALVDDVVGDFSEAINVRFARPKIAAFYRVMEQSVNAVAIILIIFCRVDPSLSGN